MFDYISINYEKQSLYNTVGILGGLYTIIKKTEAKLAKIFLLLIYYVVHKQKPNYEQHNEDPDDSKWTVPCHQIAS